MRILAHYGHIKGRATRKEYWIYGAVVGYAVNILTTAIVTGIASFLLCFVAARQPGFSTCTEADWPGTVGQGIGMFAATIAAAFISLPLAIRRAHDLGKSGHFLWQLLIPIYCVWPMIQILFFKGEANGNQYGSSPYSEPNSINEDSQMRLLKLKDLFDKGILSDKEYKDEKTKILNG